MDLAEFEARLRRALEGTLPGGAAHRLLAPRPRHGWKPGSVPDDCRDGAGLLLAYPRDGDARVVLTVRHEALPLHAGQVSLPGGAVEPGESVVRAALREAYEEIDVDPASVRVLGRLSPLHIPVSGFVLHPVVGLVRETPALRPHPGEVDRVLEVPLGVLCDPRNLGLETHAHEGIEYEIPFIRAEGEKVWGATAMILAELLELIGRPPAAPFSG